jgi:aminomethyltransferase
MQNDASSGFSRPQLEQMSTADAIPYHRCRGKGLPDPAWRATFSEHPAREPVRPVGTVRFRDATSRKGRRLMEPVDLTTLPPGARLGAFHEVQRAAGATFYESSSGRLWTAGFGDPEAEYRAVRNGTGLWDVSSLAKYHLAGRDVLPALDRLTTRAMLGVEAGTVRYEMVLNEDGLMLDEGTALILSAQEAYLLGNDGSDAFLAHLVDHTTDLDVRIENVTDRISNISVQGQGSLEILSGLTDVDLGALRWFRLVPEPVELAGVRGILVRAGFTGERGYEFYLLDGHAGGDRLWAAIVEAGATPFGFDAVDMLRVEAGLVMARREYFAGLTNPYDLSFDRFVDLDHAFIGRDACVATAEAPPRRLVTLTFEGADVPDRGVEVRAPDGPVGTVTSAVVTPGFGPLALAVVAMEYADDGAQVSVEGRPVTVLSRPIYDPDRRRPRGFEEDP